MEAFSLLKYWKGGVAGGVLVGGGDSGVTSRATTIVTAVAQPSDDDDGPFFDLELSVPDEGEEDAEAKKESNDGGFEEVSGAVDSDDEENEGEGTDGDREFKLTLSPCYSNDRVDQNLALSPSDDLFFKGRLVPIEPSVVLNGSESNLKPQFPASLLKSATNFRVLMLKFKKSRLSSTGKGTSENATDRANESAVPQMQKKEEEKGDDTNTKQSKFFTVKFKVEELPKVSLFTRENSKSANKSQKQSNAEESAAIADEKRFSKEVMQKYLKKVKPLYVRVSKRYGEKLRFSGQLSLASGLKAAVSPPPCAAAAAQKPSPPNATTTAEKSQPETEFAEAAAVSNVKNLKQGNFPAGLRVVCKHLGKSRSASSAVAAAPPAPTTSKRRDDSLLQQQDGIQSAILHCKRSFNASRGNFDLIT